MTLFCGFCFQYILLQCCEYTYIYHRLVYNSSLPVPALPIKNYVMVPLKAVVGMLILLSCITVFMQ